MIVPATRSAWLLLAACLPAAVSAMGFKPLGLPGSQLLSLSRDGRSGAGSLVGAESGGFRWSEETGAQLLAGAISVRALSASGRFVAGSSLDAGQREVASYWDASGQLVRLGGLPDTAGQGGLVSMALGISDEPRIVGTANNPEQHPLAFEWTTEQGMRVLPLPAGSTAARASGISSDGQRIYGWIQSAEGVRNGMLWQQGSATSAERPDDGASLGEVLGGNRDLSVMLGVDGDRDNGIGRPYRWQSGAPPQPLERATDLPSPQRLFVGSDDGRLLAGSAGTGAERLAIVWSTDSGFQLLQAWLADQGVSVPAGWTLTAVTGVSGDGRRLGGWGQYRGRFDSFVVDVPQAAGEAAPQHTTSDARRVD